MRKEKTEESQLVFWMQRTMVDNCFAALSIKVPSDSIIQKFSESCKTWLPIGVMEDTLKFLYCCSILKEDLVISYLPEAFQKVYRQLIQELQSSSICQKMSGELLNLTNLASICNWSLNIQDCHIDWENWIVQVLGIDIATDDLQVLLTSVVNHTNNLKRELQLVLFHVKDTNIASQKSVAAFLQDYLLQEMQLEKEAKASINYLRKAVLWCNSLSKLTEVFRLTTPVSHFPLLLVPIWKELLIQKPPIQNDKLDPIAAFIQSFHSRAVRKLLDLQNFDWTIEEVKTYSQEVKSFEDKQDDLVLLLNSSNLFGQLCELLQEEIHNQLLCGSCESILVLCVILVALPSSSQSLIIPRRARTCALEVS